MNRLNLAQVLEELPAAVTRMSGDEAAQLLMAWSAIGVALAARAACDRRPAPPQTSPGRLLSLEEAAGRLGLKPRYITRLVNRGELAGIRVGRYWRVSETALAAWQRSKEAE